MRNHLLYMLLLHPQGLPLHRFGSSVAASTALGRWVVRARAWLTLCLMQSEGLVDSHPAAGPHHLNTPTIVWRITQAGRNYWMDQKK